jgi:MFS family permease
MSATDLPTGLRAETVTESPGRSDRYKWIALINTTAGVALATIDISITMIAMPDIFRGIHLNPLGASNSFYLLWMVLGYSIVGSVLLVSFGRLGDRRGRVKIYNFGFALYTLASLILALDPLTGSAGAWWLLGFRLVQGVGGAFIVANSAAILTDAFPANERGFALGINMIAAMSGSFLGLIMGGVLAPIDWRLVFFVSVPFGVFGTLWAYLKLEERGVRTPVPMDWSGNLTFAGGLVLVMVAITYGIEPYGSHAMGWQSPRVLGCFAAGIVLIAAFFRIERKTTYPMFRLQLFKIRAFLFGSIATFLSALARGGLQFMLIIWLQGIWLPLHGYSFAQTPLWAGISMVPMTIGMVLAAPISGKLSDRFGSRPFATGGMILSAGVFGLLLLLPVNFDYPLFAIIMFCSGLSMGTFGSPNRAGVMNSLPARDRGVGGGMNSTFLNSAQVFSQGIFFTLMILGLSTTLPRALASGLEAHGIPAVSAQHLSHLPPVSVLFAAFLGYNPFAKLLGPNVLSHLPASASALLTSRSYFPHLITAPFHSGLHAVFTFSAIICLIAAVASWSRGGRYIAEEIPDAGARGPRSPQQTEEDVLQESPARVRTRIHGKSHELLPRARAKFYRREGRRVD